MHTFVSYPNVDLDPKVSSCNAQPASGLWSLNSNLRWNEYARITMVLDNDIHTDMIIWNCFMATTLYNICHVRNNPQMEKTAFSRPPPSWTLLLHITSCVNDVHCRHYMGCVHAMRYAHHLQTWIYHLHNTINTLVCPNSRLGTWLPCCEKMSVRLKISREKNRIRNTIWSKRVNNRSRIKQNGELDVSFLFGGSIHFGQIWL